MSPTPADATDQLIGDVAREHGLGGGDVLVVNDHTAGLTGLALDALPAGRSVLSWCESAERTAALSARYADAVASGRLFVGDPATPRSLADAVHGRNIQHALVRLPRTLRSLDLTARSLARAMPTISVVAGGRVKHMTRGQNAVLEQSFHDVSASLGRGKSRCLIARTPRSAVAEATTDERTVSVSVHGSTRTIHLRGLGGVFGAAAADPGSMLLLTAFADAVAAGHVPTPRTAIDLGCGNGLIAAALALTFPDAAITASDDQADAVFSTRASLAATGIPSEQVTVTWDTSASRVPAASADLVLLNPPFHDGNTLDPTIVQGMLDGAARVLRPGGTLWFVHNSHLRYRPELERRIGPTEQITRDARFTVLTATRR